MFIHLMIDYKHLVYFASLCFTKCRNEISPEALWFLETCWSDQISNDSLLEAVLVNEPELCVVMNQNMYLWDLGKRFGVLKENTYGFIERVLNC